MVSKKSPARHDLIREENILVREEPGFQHT